MLLTKEQLSSVISKYAEREKGLQDLMEVMLENMMLSERREYLNGNPSNKGNGFRQGRSYGQGRVLEFRISRDRYGNFHPKILTLLRDQEMLSELKTCGIDRIGLLVADGLPGLSKALSSVYPSTPLQRCVTHLKRNMLNRVRHGDKQELSSDLAFVFRVGQPDYSREQAWMRWEGLC